MTDHDTNVTAGDETLEATEWQKRRKRDEMTPKPEDPVRPDHLPEKKQPPAGDKKTTRLRSRRSIPAKSTDRKQSTDADYRNLTNGTGSGVTRGDSGVD
jgi:hypothetical protein